MRYFLAIFLLFGLQEGAAAQSKCAGISDRQLRLKCYDDTAAKKGPAPKAAVAMVTKPEDAVETPEMTRYVGMIDKALLENGINISVTVQTKCEKYDGLAGSPSACPALSFLGNYIDRQTTYALVKKVLNSFEEARTLGFKNVVVYGLNQQIGSRHTFDLRKPPPACSIDLCF